MQKADLIRIKHMLEAAKEAVLFAENERRESFDFDRKLVRAVVKSIEIIGEAASNITKECTVQLPQIPWPDIIGMRHL